MPVFNGEDYVGVAIESVLNQSLPDLRLVIGDNASTDATEEICREYARADRRVEYFRHESNLGLVPNWNFVYHPAGEPYFRWAGHDDVLEPQLLERCVTLLDEDPTLSLAQTLCFEIDAAGVRVRTFDDDLRLGAARPHERVWRLLWSKHLTEVWGVFRTELAAKMRKMGSYVGSDRNFTADLLLLGNVGYVEEHLFGKRSHAGSYGGGAVQGKRARVAWHDSAAKVPVVPNGLINVREYVRSILTLPLTPRDRMACLRVVMEWGLRRGVEELVGRPDAYRDKVERELARRRPLAPNGAAATPLEGGGLD
jgi:glycosyltransferase involved in cell wall biosynthesis